MSVESALQALRFQPKFMRNVARWVHVPARSARYAPFPASLDPRLAEAMAARGISQLYAHQAEAVAAGLRGEHVAVVTPAASGKTLCYNLPVLHRLLADPAARALYLYPTKALAQDQLAELHAWQERLGEGSVGERENGRVGAGGRESARSLVLTHSPILPLSLRPPPTTAIRPPANAPRSAMARASCSRTPTCSMPASSRSTRAGPRSSRI